MDAKYLKYLTANQFDPEKFLVLNAFITKMAMSKSGANVSVVAIEDPEGVASLGPGCSVVYKKWADGNGISEAYAQQEEQVEAPPKSFEEKVEIAKNIVGDTLTTATPQEAFDVPDPPTKEVVVDQIIANDIVVADIVEQRPVTELNDEEGLDLSVMSARVRYIMDKGYVNSPEDKGYVKDGNRWLDLNVVMSLDDPASFKKYVEDQSAIVWPEVVEEVKADIPDILPPEEKGPAKLTLAEEEAIKNARIEVLKDNGYVQNPKTYTFEKDGHYVSMSDITDYSVGEWRIEKHLKLMEKVPQSLKDIAKESPNVIIASVEPVKEKEPASEVLNNDTDVSNIETDVEVIETNEKEKPLEEGELRQVDPPKKEIKTIVGVGSTNFFTKFLSYKFHSVALTMARIDDERISLTVKPESRIEEKSFMDLSPIQMQGTAAEFDAEFFNEIDKPLTIASKMFAQSDTYLEELAKAEKASKMAKDKADKIKKAVEDLEKYNKGEKKTKTTLAKRIDAVLDLDPDNAVALKIREENSQGDLL